MILSEIVSLGQRLAALLAGSFFRPLARPSAALYVDCADQLAEAADEGGQIAHDEARGLIREVLIAHPDTLLDDDEGGRLVDVNQRAGQFFNKLLEAGWIQDRRISLDERWVLIAPRLRLLLRLLRDLAEDRPAELKDFAATLRSLCEDLLRPGAFDANQLGPEEMRQRVKDLQQRAGRAIDQMHAVETLVAQHETAQRGPANTWCATMLCRRAVSSPDFISRAIVSRRRRTIRSSNNGWPKAWSNTWASTILTPMPRPSAG